MVMLHVEIKKFFVGKRLYIKRRVLDLFGLTGNEIYTDKENMM